MRFVAFHALIFKDGWLLLERIDPANVRAIEYNALLEAEKVAEATKQAIKRKIAQAASVDFQSRSLPAKLRIADDDPEDVVSYSVQCFCRTF